MQLEALTSVMLNVKKSERVLGGKMFPENTDVGSYQIPYSAVILHLHVHLDACLRWDKVAFIPSATLFSSSV